MILDILSWISIAIGAFFVLVSGVGVWRMAVRPAAAPDARTPYVYTPRTTFGVGRLLRRRR